MQPSITEVRRPPRIHPHALGQALQAFPANVLYPSAKWHRCRVLIQEHRDPQFIGQAAAHFTGDLHAVLDGDLPNRNERDHIRRADPRMFASMSGKINALKRFPGGNEGRLGHGFGRADERDDGAVVIRVALLVQHDAS